MNVWMKKTNKQCGMNKYCRIISTLKSEKVSFWKPFRGFHRPKTSFYIYQTSEANEDTRKQDVLRRRSLWGLTTS